MGKEFIFKSMEKSSGGSGIVLPNHRDLSSSLLGFLDINFSDQNDLSSLLFTASDLEKELNQKCEDLDTDLVNLRGNLGKIIVSWICRSIGAKSALHKLNLNIQGISSCCECPLILLSLFQISNLKSVCVFNLWMLNFEWAFEKSIWGWFFSREFHVILRYASVNHVIYVI